MRLDHPRHQRRRDGQCAAGGFAGNVIIGGVIGMGVDAVSGATLDHYPNPATIVLEPVDPENPATPVYQAPSPPPSPPIVDDGKEGAKVS
jgi:hypothetical protein